MIAILSISIANLLLLLHLPFVVPFREVAGDEFLEIEWDGRRARETLSVASALVLRIVDANGKEPILSRQDIGDIMFAETNSTARQFHDCSGGDFKLVPYNYADDARVNGVINIYLDDAIETLVMGRTMIIAFQKACAIVGGDCDNPYSLLNDADLTLVVAPGGAIDCHPGGCAFGPVGGDYLYSYYGDSSQFGISSFWVANVMHELGHNFGLKHAREDGKSYGDQTGPMGQTFPANSKLCYNGWNLFELGWQRDFFIEIDVADESSCTVDVIGIADLNDFVNANVKLGAKIGDDIMVSFNRRKDFTIQTREHWDKVLVHDRFFGSSSPPKYETDLEGVLDDGDTFEYDGVTVTVCSKTTMSDTIVVNVALGVGARCSDKPCVPTEMPSTFPSPLPSKPLSESPTLTSTQSPIWSPTNVPTASSPATPVRSPSNYPTVSPISRSSTRSPVAVTKTPVKSPVLIPSQSPIATSVVDPSHTPVIPSTIPTIVLPPLSFPSATTRPNASTPYPSTFLFPSMIPPAKGMSDKKMKGKVKEAKSTTSRATKAPVTSTPLSPTRAPVSSVPSTNSSTRQPFTQLPTRPSISQRPTLASTKSKGDKGSSKKSKKGKKNGKKTEKNGKKSEKIGKKSEKNGKKSEKNEKKKKKQPPTLLPGLTGSDRARLVTDQRRKIHFVLEQWVQAHLKRKDETYR